MKIIQAVDEIRNKLKSECDFIENPIDLAYSIVPPFSGGEEVKLIVLGQDPTIKNIRSRSKIQYTLNLDKKNALTNYILRICSCLGVELNNVYATNLFKYFYTIRPANTMLVLETHLQPNLELLKCEMERFPGVPIVSLGRPVLRLLTNSKEEVNRYWAYNKKSKDTDGRFSFLSACENKLQRDLFILPHQPSLRKEFYSSNLDAYLQFIRANVYK